MAKVKVHRTTPSLDMTPMVDLAFLLVTFFMLTTKFAAEEPVVVDMPSSIAEIKLPDTDIMTILISKEGKILFNMDGKYARERLIARMGEKYGIQFSPREIYSFSILPSFGIPIGQLKEYLAMPPEERKRIPHSGIPADSLNNELADWVVNARLSNPKVRIAIKGDAVSEFPAVQKVLKTLKEKKINRFNLITNLQAGPAQVEN